MDKHWCMCTVLQFVARDTWSTCSICGGKDAYGKSEDRPKDKRKVLKVCGECKRFPCGKGGVHPVEKTDRACCTFKQTKKKKEKTTHDLLGEVESEVSYLVDALESQIKDEYEGTSMLYENLADVRKGKRTLTKIRKLRRAAKE